MPETTVNLPVIGSAPKSLVYAGGAIVAGIVGYAWWRGRGAGAAPTVEPPSEQLPSTIGSVSTGGGTSDTGAVFITTNAQWSADALAKMIDLGYDSVAVSTALGKFLSSQLVTAIEAQYVYTAIGLSGQPPVGNFSVRLQPATPSPSPRPSTGTAAKPATTVWQGYRLTRRRTWLSIATQFASSKTPNGIESTKRAIFERNPSLVARYGSHNATVLPAGSIVLVPIHK